MVTTRGRPRSFDRDEVLDRAIRLFWERGYEATSVRDLTERLGIEAPSLYRAFGDKRALFGEAVRRYDGDYGGFIERALGEEPTARAAALRMLREGPGRYTRDGLPRGCLVAGGDAGTADERVHAVLRSLRDGKVELLADRVRRDVRAGVLPGGLDPVALARFTMGTLNSLAGAAREGVPVAELDAIAAIAARAWPGEARAGAS